MDGPARMTIFQYYTNRWFYMVLHIHDSSGEWLPRASSRLELDRPVAAKDPLPAQLGALQAALQLSSAVLDRSEDP